MRVLVLGNDMTDEFSVFYIPDFLEYDFDLRFGSEIEFLKSNQNSFQDFASWWTALITLGASITGWLTKYGGYVYSGYKQWEKFRSMYKSFFVKDKFLYCRYYCNSRRCGE